MARSFRLIKLLHIAGVIGTLYAFKYSGGTMTDLGHSEFPSIDGIPVIYSTAAKIALQRPNKFNVVVSGDGPSSSSTTISGQLGVA